MVAGLPMATGLAVPDGVAAVGFAPGAAGLGTVLAAGEVAVGVTTAVPDPALVAGTATAGRTAPGAPGRLGLTVMRAVSLGGALLTTDVPVLTTEVPDLGLVSGVAVGVAARGLSGGLAPGLPTGEIGLMGETGETPPGVIGLIGLTGAGGAPVEGLANGWTGAGGVEGFTGMPPPLPGVDGGGLGGSAAATMGGFWMTGSVRRAGATAGVVLGVIGVVAGPTRGGGTAALDCFWGSPGSAMGGGDLMEGEPAGEEGPVVTVVVPVRGGRAGVTSNFLVSGGGGGAMEAVLVGGGGISTSVC